MDIKEKEYLQKLYKGLKHQQRYNCVDSAETYSNGYRWGKVNGKLELIEQLLNIPSGMTCDKEEAIK